MAGRTWSAEQRQAASDRVQKRRQEQEQAMASTQERMPLAIGKARENRAEQVAGERRRRKDITPLANLNGAIPDHLRDDKRYRYRWLVDRGDRISRKTIDDDWDLVSEEEMTRGARQTGAGTRVEQHAGIDKFGAPQRRYLARKLNEHYVADKKAEQDLITKRMQDIKRGPQKTAPDGSPVQSDGAYIPDRGIHIQENYQP